MGKSRYVMLHLMSIALVKYLLLEFESTVQPEQCGVHTGMSTVDFATSSF